MTKTMKIITTIWCCLIIYNLQAQAVAVEITRNNLMYAGLNNYLTIAVENTDCSQIWVKTDNGIIRKASSDCNYECIPKYMGVATLFIYKLENKDTVLLEEWKYRVKPIKGEARVGNKKDGEMTLGYFKAQPVVGAPILNMDMTATCNIKRFRMQIIRKGIVLVTCENKGARFNTETRANFNMLQEGDVVFFDQIMTQCPGMRVPYANNTVRIQIKK